MTGLPLADVELYLRGRGLLALYPDTRIVRSRPDDATLRAGKGRMVILTRGGGPGLTGGEETVDRVIVTVRTVGVQDRGGVTAYDDAERFADTVDRLTLSGVKVAVGSRVAFGVFRAGGAPTHVDTDQGRRVHMQCSYVFPVASGL